MVGREECVDLRVIEESGYDKKNLNKVLKEPLKNERCRGLVVKHLSILVTKL